MTELRWDGKYDQDGRKVAPLRAALPFQTIETVNESAQDRQTALDLFASGRATDWRNRLIWGDKKYVLPSLLPEFGGQVNLIYIDPPFNVGADFSFTTTVPSPSEGEGQGEGGETSFTKEPSVIEQKAYRDTWGRGMDSYLQWFYETAALLHELLAEDGSIYVHLDWHVGHYAKVVLDEVFGVDRFSNEIIWKRSTPRAHVYSRYPSTHDVIFYYSKTDKSNWNAQFIPHTQEYLDKYYRYIDEKSNRRYSLDSLINPNHDRPTLTYEWGGVTRVWRYTKDRMRELDLQGRIYYPEGGGVPRFKRYLDEMEGVPVTSIWSDISPINSQANEDTSYSTQKPEALLERILKASSNEGDLVLDCFCGSGTTAATAEKLGRRWITCDLGRFAIHTARKRLLGISGVKPFVVQNLGKYERQAWQADLTPNPSPKERGEQQQRAYIEFILSLYHARPLQGYAWLHGLKAGRMVHVGSVDAPITPADVTAIASEFRKAVGTGKDAPSSNSVDVLGWDFAFEINEVAKQQANAANIQMRFVRIPRDVMDKRAAESGEIQFFELAALGVQTQVKKRALTLTLSDFVIPPDDVPADVQRAITHWSQWIDYWAVDFDFKDDTFHNQWQSYRTRKDKTLRTQVTWDYEAAGEYEVVVKVIDILGNDTTKLVRVGVK